jgi:hypothetical protein
MTHKINKARFIDEADNLFLRLESQYRLDTVDPNGITPRAIQFDKKTFAKKVWQWTNEENFTPSPAILRTAVLDKKRELASFGIGEQLVHGVVAKKLGEELQSSFSPHLYSYRKGYSVEKAVYAFGKYIRKHLRKNKEVKSRGLFVIRGDIKSYTDSIPLDDSSPLWGLLSSKSQLPLTFLKQLLRFRVKEENGSEWSSVRGIPLGIPLTPVIANTYLNSIDEKISNLPQGFYARYGDDILFAHEDLSTTLIARKILESELLKLRLSLNQKKVQQLYFTANGKSLPENREWSATQFINYLGYQITFRGEIGITHDKQRALLASFRRRIKNSFPLLSSEKQTEQIVQLANLLLKEFLISAESFSLRFVNSRSQLKEIDYQVALALSELLTRQRGVRSFRTLSWKQLKTKFRLISLCALKHRVTP